MNPECCDFLSFATSRLRPPSGQGQQIPIPENEAAASRDWDPRKSSWTVLGKGTRPPVWLSLSLSTAGEEGREWKGGHWTTFRARLQIRVVVSKQRVSLTTRLFQAQVFLLLKTCCGAVCLHAVWVAETGKVWVKPTAGRLRRLNHMPCHLKPPPII